MRTADRLLQYQKLQEAKVQCKRQKIYIYYIYYIYISLSYDFVFPFCFCDAAYIVCEASVLSCSISPIQAGHESDWQNHPC